MPDISYLLHSMVQYTHFISFGLLILAGFNLPVSEDIVFIVSASIAATAVPENTVLIFAGCFMGAYLSDIIAYSIGRYGINRILFSPLLNRLRIVNRAGIELKLVRVKGFFDRFGGKTLFFGRFVPFGVRNVMFMSCGLIRMPYPRFMLIDLSALLCTSSLLFFLGYSFGNNYEIILTYINRYKILIFALFVSLVLFLFIRKKISIHRDSAAAKNMAGVSIPKNDTQP
jgi:membrane-associated protein